MARVGDDRRRGDAGRAPLPPPADSVHAVSDSLSIHRERVAPPELIAELEGRHVAVVGINYVPEVTGIAPYTSALAEHLAGSAASVTVLTGTPHYPHWTVPGEYRWRLRSTDRALRAAEVIDVTDSAVRADGGTARAVAAARYPEVHRLRHFVPRSQSVLRRGLYEATFFANARTVRLSRRPQLVVAVTPSLGGAVAGAALAARYGAKLLVVVQDLLGKAAQQSGMAGGGRVARATAAIESHALRRADRVAVVSEAFRPHIERYGVPSERISLLRNWTHITPIRITAEQARAQLGWPVAPFTVVHTGNIGLKQDLGNVVAAARRLKARQDIQFVLVGDGSQRSAVQELAADLAGVRFLDPLDEQEYPLALAAADLLLVNERPGVAEMSLPSKLTSYLSAGRPVLAAVEPAGTTAAELARTRGAALMVPPGDPDALADAVQKLSHDPVGRAEMASAGEGYAFSTLGRRAATDRLDEIVRGMLTDVG